MKPRIAFLLLIVTLLATSFTRAIHPLIRKRGSEVRFTLVATDPNGRPQLQLSPADIIVLEDGQPIPHFELRSAADLPVERGHCARFQ